MGSFFFNFISISYRESKLLLVVKCKDSIPTCLNFLSNLDDNTGHYQINTTSITTTGELKITKLDFNKNIVSGTFWFDVKDDKDVVHQIREGRFDMKFSQ